MYKWYNYYDVSVQQMCVQLIIVFTGPHILYTWNTCIAHKLHNSHILYNLLPTLHSGLMVWGPTKFQTTGI